MRNNQTAHPRSYKPYLYGIAGLGLAAIAISLFDAMSALHSYHWVILASLTVITGAFTIRIPGTNSKISVADTFVFTNIILFGPAAGTLTAALDGFMGSIRAKTVSRRGEFALFNVCSMSLAAYGASKAFFWILGKDPLYQQAPTHLADLLLPVFVLAAVHYFINAGVVSGIVALEARENFLRTWQEKYLWTLPTYLACATVAMLLALNVRSLSPVIFAALLPVLLVSYLSYKTYLEREEERLHGEELNNLYLSTVEALALAVDAKDPSTYGHIRRVRSYAASLAKLFGIVDKNELMAIETAALLHDIGKLAIDDYILRKPGRLSKQEFEKMKMHTTAGDEILRLIPFPYPVARYVRSHHERWDGLGYPDRLKGDVIPLGARILSIADAYDAIRSSRPYKTSFDVRESIEFLRVQGGTLYDPSLVELFSAHIEEIEAQITESVKVSPAFSFRSRFDGLETGPLETDEAVARVVLSHHASAELDELFDFCKDAGRHQELADFCMLLERRMRRLVPFNTCAFYLTSGDEGLKAIHTGGKCAELIRDRTIELGKGISGWVASYRKPIYNTAPAMEFQGLDGDFARLTDTLSVPIISNGQCFGALTLYAEPPVFYSQTHLGLMQIVVNEIAPVLASLNKTTSVSDSRKQRTRSDRAFRISEVFVAGSQMIESMEREQRSFSLLFFELTNIDHLTQLCGEQSGHSLLLETEKVLRAKLPVSDALVLRYSPEGFVVLLGGVDREAATEYLRQIDTWVRTTPIGSVAEYKVHLECRNGIATYPQDGTTIFSLLEAAKSGRAEEDRHFEHGSNDLEEALLKAAGNHPMDFSNLNQQIESISRA